MLSTRARNLLRRISESEDGELVRNVPGGCWVDDHQVNGRDVMELLRYCLIHCDLGFGTNYEVFSLNEEGRAILVDPNYQPLILRAIGSQ